jgi:Trp operon repressor
MRLRSDVGSVPAGMTCHTGSDILESETMKSAASKKMSSLGVAIAVPAVSAFPSRAAWEEAVWDVFIGYLASQDRKNALITLLDVLITEPEQRRLIHRIAAVDRILAGEKYRTIGKELWLTRQTLTSIKKALIERRYRSYRERGKTERKKKIYSPGPRSATLRYDPSKRRVRTKYGTLHI